MAKSIDEFRDPKSLDEFIDLILNEGYLVTFTTRTLLDSQGDQIHFPTGEGLFYHPETLHSFAVEDVFIPFLASHSAIVSIYSTVNGIPRVLFQPR